MATRFELKPSQLKAYKRLQLFLSRPGKGVFILKGYAGTGKSTLIREIIELMKQKEISFSLMASTGRAAKIISNITGCEARTVHSQIYTFKSLNQDIETMVNKRNTDGGVDKTGQLLLNFDLLSVQHEPTSARVYVIDEASMISDKADTNAVQAIFGSSRLLSDLLLYHPDAKYIFVGDECQLPPISQAASPALSSIYLRENFGFDVEEFSLTEIVRQQEDNDIIQAASRIRELYQNPPVFQKWAKFPLLGYRNIRVFPNQSSLLADYVMNLKTNGFNHSTLLSFSNKGCDNLTSIIRPQLGFSDRVLQTGDLLLVSQNNYISGLMNGDLVVVEEIGVKEQRAMLNFVKVSVKELFTGKVYSLFLLENILYSGRTNISQPEQKELLVDYYFRMKNRGVHQKNPFFNKMMLSDPYLNALRAVFGFTLTCHKAQGGEWDQVYLDISKQVPGLEKPYVYQWLYTAMTRAKTQLNIALDWWIT